MIPSAKDGTVHCFVLPTLFNNIRSFVRKLLCSKIHASLRMALVQVRGRIDLPPLRISSHLEVLRRKVVDCHRAHAALSGTLQNMHRLFCGLHFPTSKQHIIRR